MSAGYKQALHDAMTALGKEPDTVVVGYNTSQAGGHGGGSFKGFPEERLIECPLAENCMMGVAIGLSLDGLIPIVWVERMDFLMNMTCAIVNHLDKIAQLSDGLHKPACIIRCVVGNSKTPLFTGATHHQNHSEAMRKMVSFPVIELDAPDSIEFHYVEALRCARMGRSTMIVEEKDRY